MNKIKNLNESEFMKLFFCFVGVFFVAAAVCMPDRGQALSGFWTILTSTAKVSTNYFAVGGYAATFLNMGLVALIYYWLFTGLKATANNVSTLGLLLTVGFAAWGINVLNIWPTILGVVLYGLVKKEKLSSLANAMMYSTGIAPIISEMLLRYPNADTVGFNLLGLFLALVVGIFIGFCLPAGLGHAPKVHKGFDLYSAAVPIGMMAFILQGTLYKTMGVALPAAPGADTLAVASLMIVNLFCVVFFGACIVLALAMGYGFMDYWKLLTGDFVPSISAAHGNGALLMNVGVYGLFILAYYNLIGASFNAVTFGCIFCMLACCNSGSTPTTVWPIMLGYVAASFGCGWLSQLLGGSFALGINAQAIVIGLCFANGLSPIAGRYGWHWGVLSAVLHYLLVSSVPNLHGGFCLYNGGLTAALICIFLVPVIEKFALTKEEKKALQNP